MKLTTAPRMERQKRKVQRLVSPARIDDRETGRTIRKEVREPGAKDFTVIEEPETERVFVPAVHAEAEDDVAVWVVETVPLTPKQAAVLPAGHPVVTERHDFATEDDAKRYYAARQRQGRG